MPTLIELIAAKDAAELAVDAAATSYKYAQIAYRRRKNFMNRAIVITKRDNFSNALKAFETARDAWEIACRRAERDAAIRAVVQRRKAKREASPEFIF